MRVRFALVAAGVALAVGLGCGDVPTLPNGIAYVTPILTPSPSVAFGDTLRDSLGDPAPLRVVALGRSPGDTIRDVSLRFLLTSLNLGGTITAAGYLIAPDSLVTLRLVAQVTDGTSGSGLQLQTPELSIEVTAKADSLDATSPIDTSVTGLTPIVPLSVRVTGVGPSGARATVNGIVVRFRIVRSFPANTTAERRYTYLSGDNNVVLRPDSTLAVDTTSGGGLASRSFVGLLAPTGETNPDSVVVEAKAFSQKGAPLGRSPLLFTIRIKKS
jgi:hypothetical protein